MYFKCTNAYYSYDDNIGEGKFILIYIHYFSVEYKFIEYPRLGIPLLLFIFNIKTKLFMFFSDSEMLGVEEMGKRRRKPLANKSDSFINPFEYA